VFIIAKDKDTSIDSGGKGNYNRGERNNFMRILLTNDDGIFAPGLAAIYKELVKIEGIGEVVVVAPAASKSGASHSITFNRPFVCNKVDIDGEFSGYSVEGSPADCVKLAVLQLHKEPFDLLIAGMNNGANAGINAYYSGTVAAAMEGAFLGIPSVAMSAATEEIVKFTEAAGYCTQVLKKLMPLESGYVVNINIPQLSRGEPKGVRVVPQSTEGFHEYYVRRGVGENGTAFQLAGGEHRDQHGYVDTKSLAEGFITITAFSPGMTDFKNTEKLKKIKW